MLPIFRQAATIIADPQVRNRGTIGGSLANADPAADWPAVVVALHAELELAGPNGRRRVAAKDFFVDIFTTALEAGEMIAGIHVPRPTPGMHFRYRKIRHPASGYAVVGIAVGVRLQDGLVADVSIGVTGAASHAFAGRSRCGFPDRQGAVTREHREASQLLSETTECLSDRYASAEYRANLVRSETRRALHALST